MLHKLALLTVIAASTLLPASDQKVLLRRQLIPNDDAKYAMKMDMKMTMSRGGSGEMTSNATITCNYDYKTGAAVKEGKIPMTVAMTDMHVDSDSPLPMSDQPDMTISGMLNELNAVSDVKMEGGNPSSKAMVESMMTMVQNLNAFPEKAVAPGDTWDLNLPLSAMGMQDVTIHLKFEGTKHVDGKDYWDVSADQDYPLDMDMAAMAKASGSAGDTSGMSAKGTAHIKMDLLFDTTGRPYTVTSTSSSDVTISGQNGDMHMLTDATMSMTPVK